MKNFFEIKKSYIHYKILVIILKKIYFQGVFKKSISKKNW